MRVLLLAAVLCSCGQFHGCRTVKGADIDLELTVYYQEFIDAMTDRDITAKYYISSIKWIDELDSTDQPETIITAGICKTITWLDVYHNYVQINKNTPDSILRNVVWHESVHCALGLDHHEGELDLMNSIVPDTKNYAESLKLLNKVLDRYQKGVED